MTQRPLVTCVGVWKALRSLLKCKLKYLQTHPPHPPALPRGKRLHPRANTEGHPRRDEQVSHVEGSPQWAYHTHRKGFVCDPICSNDNSSVIAHPPLLPPWLGHATAQNANLQILGTSIQTTRLKAHAANSAAGNRGPGLGT